MEDSKVNDNINYSTHDGPTSKVIGHTKCNIDNGSSSDSGNPQSTATLIDLFAKQRSNRGEGNDPLAGTYKENPD
eukprot:3644578-Heterocapsa_arctica.AAC.1